MFLRFDIYFLAFILISFVGILPTSAMDSDGELYRVDGKGKVVARYVDNLELEDCTYNLDFPVDRQLTKEAYDISTWDEKYRRSHVLVNGFDVYGNDSGFFCEYAPFTTRTFHNVGIGEEATDLRIDWMSEASNLKDTETVFRRKSITGNKHSEPQLIVDIEALWSAVWKTKPDLLLNLLLPCPQTLADSRVAMTGIELYGSYDMCDNCLQSLVDFRKKHQRGNESISYAIRDKLKNKCTNVDENRFVIIYHATTPYAGNPKEPPIKYHTRYKGKDYTLGYEPAAQGVVRGNTVQYNNVCPAFAVEYTGESLNEDPNLEEASLVQTKHVVVEKDIIYGQLHRLHEKVAKYQKPDIGNKFKFIFDKK